MWGAIAEKRVDECFSSFIGSGISLIAAQFELLGLPYD
jgi:hypothetical protein